MADEKEEDRRYFRTFGVLLAIEAVLAVLFISPQSPSMPWWLPGLMVLTPPGWILPWIAAYLFLKGSEPPSKPATIPTFATSSRLEDYSRLPSDWATAFAGWGYDIDRLYAQLGNLYATGEGRVAPHRHYLFRAFHLTPISEVKVVILGQDPYPRVDSADGLAFSQRGAVEPGTSLRRMLDSAQSDRAVRMEVSPSGDLGSWAQQGVLLLNRALTVLEGRPASHLAAWKDFCDTALRIVDARRPEAIFLCLGRPAVEAVAAVKGARVHPTVVITAHPMARDLDDSDLPRFGASRPFQQVNERLASAGERTIRWDA